MNKSELHLFGTPQFVRSGTQVRLKRRKVTALLAYVAVDGVPRSREVLATLLFPEQDESRAKANFRHTLALLREIAGKECIGSDKSTVWIVDESPLWVDVRRFRELLPVGKSNQPEIERCREAVGLYRGEFLEGLSIGANQRFDDWVGAEREALRADCIAACRRLVADCCENGAHEDAIGYTRQLLELDVFDESAHRLLMGLFAESGRYADALDQYHRCRSLLNKELGRDPDEETEILYQEIRNSSGRSMHRYSRETPFVGRAKETGELEHDLMEAREGKGGIVLISGEPGVGKTRLILELLL